MLDDALRGSTKDSRRPPCPPASGDPGLSARGRRHRLGSRRCRARVGEARDDTTPRHADGVGPAVTDAVRLRGELMHLSAAAEDSPNIYDDGQVEGSSARR